jgi:hypothetical protein
MGNETLPIKSTWMSALAFVTACGWTAPDAAREDEPVEARSIVSKVTTAPHTDLQPGGARVGPFSAANHWRGATGDGPDEQPGRTFAIAFFSKDVTLRNQYLWGFNSATTGWALTAGDKQDLYLQHEGSTARLVANIYRGLNVIAWTVLLDGSIRWSAEGGVARPLKSAGAYIPAAASAVHSLGFNAAKGNYSATQHSVLWTAVIDAQLADADLAMVSGAANALDRWNPPAVAAEHPQLRWLSSWDDWDGASASFAGDGSSPYALTRIGNGGTKRTLPAYKRFLIDESAVWDGGELRTQGKTGIVGTRRSAYAHTRFISDATDIDDAPGLVVESLASTWNIASWPGQIQAGVQVNGANLAGNNNGLVPTPGIYQKERYGLTRAVDCVGVSAGAAKAFTVTDGMQVFFGTTVQSASTALAVRIPENATLSWVPRAAPTEQIINVFDSKGGQIEGLTNDPDQHNPTYDAWPMLQRKHVPYGMRVANEGWGSGTWYQRISTPQLRSATVATLSKLAAGTESNRFWTELGTNDYGLVTYLTLAAFEADLVAFARDMIALGLPGFELRLVGPTARKDETVENAHGWNLPQLRATLSRAVTATANPAVTYEDASGFVSEANLPDGLHANLAGHVEYEAGMRAVMGD